MRKRKEESDPIYHIKVSGKSLIPTLLLTILSEWNFFIGDIFDQNYGFLMNL